MRKTFSLLALHLSLVASAQVYKDSVKAQFLRYSNLIIQRKTAQAAEYMNPAFFTLVSKQQLIKLMEQVYSTPGMDFTAGSPTIISVSDDKLISGVNYVKLTYSSALAMHFEEKDGKPRDTASLKAAFGKQFGPENVSYDGATDTYHIVTVKKAVANSADKKRWTFVVIEERQKTILAKFIPKELL